MNANCQLPIAVLPHTRGRNRCKVQAEWKRIFPKILAAPLLPVIGGLCVRRVLVIRFKPRRLPRLFNFQPLFPWYDEIANSSREMFGAAQDVSEMGLTFLWNQRDRGHPMEPAAFRQTEPSTRAAPRLRTPRGTAVSAA